MKGYNGWANYETWNTALYFTQDGQFEGHLPDYVDDVCGLARIIESEVWEYVNDDLNGSGYIADMVGVAVSEVNWYELAETLLADYDPDVID